MSLRKRLIARLDIKGNMLIKGIRFEGLRVIGESTNYAKKYAQSGVDELLYIDLVASLYGRNGLVEILKNISKEVFIPITAGGGIRSVKDAEKLLSAGADKVAINSAALKNPNLINELSRAFGRQCVVASIQARKMPDIEMWEALGDGGRERSDRKIKSWINELEDRGAGEILLTSVYKDGTLNGFDSELIQEIPKNLKIPLIYGGGICSHEDIKECLKKPFISAVSVGKALHYNRIKIDEFKNAEYKNINLRKIDLDKELKINKIVDLNLKNIAIIDYGMGNTQSLKNALDILGFKSSLTNKINELDKSSLIALPGVGAFPEGVQRLKDIKLFDYLKNAEKKSKPIFGICLGMQLLFEDSEEFEYTKGLSLLKGSIKKLPEKDIESNLQTIPHVGWNKLIPQFKNYEHYDCSDKYFVHSYSAKNCDEKIISHICMYGGHPIISAVKKNNVAGCQFHPERSGVNGLIYLKNTILNLIN